MHNKQAALNQIATEERAVYRSLMEDLLPESDRVGTMDLTEYGEELEFATAKLHRLYRRRWKVYKAMGLKMEDVL